MNEPLVEAMAQSLRELIARGGPGALSDERRVRGKLLDDHGSELAAIDVLIQALKLGVPERLAKHDPALTAAVLKRETERLQTRQGIERSLAAGAVRTWALALDIPVPNPQMAPSPSPPRRLWKAGLAAIVLLGLAAGGVLYLRPGPPPPFEASNPLTWPLAAKGHDYAVVWRRGAPEGCPRDWTAATAGCVHAGRDLGMLTRAAPASSNEPDALFYEVDAKSAAGCSSDTSYSSDRYCLSETPFPDETLVLVAPMGLHGCSPFEEKIPIENHCLKAPLSPALRGPWSSAGFAHGTGGLLDPVPPALTIDRAKNGFCGRTALLQNPIGFCLSPPTL